LCWGKAQAVGLQLHGAWVLEKLSSDVLDCEKRIDIAVGTARGLAYLHE